MLAEVAPDRDTELIVVGAGGRGALRPAVLGSVFSEVERRAPCPGRAPCPVMIVPEV